MSRLSLSCSPKSVERFLSGSCFLHTLQLGMTSPRQHGSARADRRTLASFDPGRSGDTSSIFLRVNELAAAHLKKPKHLLSGATQTLPQPLQMFCCCVCSDRVPVGPSPSARPRPRPRLTRPSRCGRSGSERLHSSLPGSTGGLISLSLRPGSDFHKSKLKPTSDKLILH